MRGALLRVTSATRRLALLLMILFLYSAYSPVLEAVEGQPFDEMHYLMGTLWKISLYASSRAEANRAFDAAFSEIKRLDRLMSDYDPESELSRLNRTGFPGPVRVDPDLFDVLEQSVEFSRKSQGAFDITVAPLVRAWGFRGGGSGVPSEEVLERTRRAVGFWHLKLDPKRSEVSFLKEGMALDLGAIGKGYAVDRVVALFRERGIERALIDSGGMLFALGAPPGRDGWPAGVADPSHRDRVARWLTIRNEALATSSQSERAITVGKKRYGHILDPRTGWPLPAWGSVTVRAPSATLADGWSTACFVLGPAASRRLAKSEPRVKMIYLR